MSSKWRNLNFMQDTVIDKDSILVFTVIPSFTNEKYSSYLQDLRSLQQSIWRIETKCLDIRKASLYFIIIYANDYPLKFKVSPQSLQINDSIHMIQFIGAIHVPLQDLFMEINAGNALDIDDLICYYEDDE